MTSVWPSFALLAFLIFYSHGGFFKNKDVDIYLYIFNLRVKENLYITYLIRFNNLIFIISTIFIIHIWYFK